MCISSKLWLFLNTDRRDFLRFYITVNDLDSFINYSYQVKAIFPILVCETDCELVMVGNDVQYICS